MVVNIEGKTISEMSLFTPEELDEEVIDVITKTNSKIFTEAMEQLNAEKISGKSDKKDDFHFTSQRAKEAADLMSNMHAENFDWDLY